MLYFQGFQNIPDAEFFEKDFFLKLKKTDAITDTRLTVRDLMNLFYTLQHT